MFGMLSRRCDFEKSGFGARQKSTSAFITCNAALGKILSPDSQNRRM